MKNILTAFLCFAIIGTVSKEQDFWQQKCTYVLCIHTICTNSSSPHFLKWLTEQKQHSCRMNSHELTKYKQTDPQVSGVASNPEGRTQIISKDQNIRALGLDLQPPSNIQILILWLNLNRHISIQLKLFLPYNDSRRSMPLFHVKFNILYDNHSGKSSNTLAITHNNVWIAWNNYLHFIITQHLVGFSFKKLFITVTFYLHAYDFTGWDDISQI